jgi:hypothetical protein
MGVVFACSATFSAGLSTMFTGVHTGPRATQFTRIFFSTTVLRQGLEDEHFAPEDGGIQRKFVQLGFCALSHAF